MSTLSLRLRTARKAAGFSQEQLGIYIGLEPASASARMNRYEQGTRVPDLELVARIADALKLPAAYFYATQEDEAELLRRFHFLTTDERKRLLDQLPISRSAAQFHG